MNIVEARGVTKTYKRGGFFSMAKSVPVLKGVNLSIAEGECVGLVGRSGSGKSTLGRIMLGLEAPTDGEVRILDRPTSYGNRLQIDRDQRRAVQVVFQDAVGSLNPRLTAKNIIAEPLRNFERLRGGALDERVAELLQQVGLHSDDAGKHPSQFSGGQLQRISIARALAARPRCIILDEAVSSQDMLVQAKILDLLDALQQKKHVAYLFITHDLRLVKRFCDQAVAMENGVLVKFDHRQYHQAQMSGSLGELAAAMLPATPSARCHAC
jgi:nickel transport system ATP-binding protein